MLRASCVFTLFACVAVTAAVEQRGNGKQYTATAADYVNVVPTLRAGDVLALAAGSYTQDLNCNNLTGSDGAWITIQGPPDGSAVFSANGSTNTVEIASCSYLAIKNLTLDGKHLDGPFGVSANGGSSNKTHHILIENCLIKDYDGGQQMDGISTKCATWGWIIRSNRIVNVGTGLYLGNSNGNDPFIGGVIENNLVVDSIGYCLQIKHQNAWPAPEGLPKGPNTTIIRDNVFIKTDRASPDGNRPNVLVDGFPESGPGSEDLYQIYGNFFYHNPNEALLQASGRVAIHDNLFVDVAGTAIALTTHQLPLKLAYVYNNTIYSAGAGIRFGTTAKQGDAVIGNLVFAGAPIGGAIANNRDNITGGMADAERYVAKPSIALGAMDFHPKSGQCTGNALDLSTVAKHADYKVDFDRAGKGAFAYRGAYANGGGGRSWKPAASRKSETATKPQVPVFDKTTVASVAKLEALVEDRKIGAALTGLKKLTTSTKGPEKAAATEAVAAIDKWITEQRGAIEDARNEGDVLAAAELAAETGKSLAGNDAHKEFDDLAGELRKDPNYSAGKDWRVLESKAAGLPANARKTAIQAFLAKHKDGYYADQARKLLE